MMGLGRPRDGEARAPKFNIIGAGIGVMSLSSSTWGANII